MPDFPPHRGKHRGQGFTPASADVLRLLCLRYPRKAGYPPTNRKPSKQNAQTEAGLGVPRQGWESYCFLMKTKGFHQKGIASWRCPFCAIGAKHVSYKT